MDRNARSSKVDTGHYFRLVGGMSIKRKLVLIIMLVSSVAMLLAGGAFITYQWFAFRQRMVSDLATHAKILADNLTGSIAFNVPEDAEDVLNSLEAKEPIAFACVYLNDGSEFASYRRESFSPGSSFSRLQREGYRFKKGWLEVRKHIQLNGRAIGSLYLQSDLRELSTFLEQSIIALPLLIILASLAAYALSSRLQRVISRPLFHLAKVSEIVSKNEDYSIRAVKSSEDEIGLLTDAFNNMLTQIEKRDSDQKRKEEELHRLRNLLSNIINSMPSVLVGVDGNGRVTHWNREAEAVTGIGAEKAHGRLLTDVFPQMASEMGKVQDAIQERTSRKNEKIAREVNGEIRYSDVTVYPLITNGVDGVVIRVDDVTERVRIEEMMIQSEKMLSIGGLAAGMAHEINNPLSGIMQNFQVVLNRIKKGLAKNIRIAEECGTTMEAIQAYMSRRGIYLMIESIMESGRRASKIVDNMLNFSQKGTANFANHDLCALLNKTVELAANDYDLKKKYDFRRIKIYREYDTTLPEVSCEASMIQQVFFNILKNGAQAMSGQRSVREPPCFVLRVVNEGQMARVEVEDNGPGLDEAGRKRIFEPFFTNKGVGYGTGLGLAVSYFIITETHGGTMSVESSLGNGTRFIIRLPIERTVQC